MSSDHSSAQRSGRVAPRQERHHDDQLPHLAHQEDEEELAIRGDVTIAGRQRRRELQWRQLVLGGHRQLARHFQRHLGSSGAKQKAACCQFENLLIFYVFIWYSFSTFLLNFIMIFIFKKQHIRGTNFSL